MGYTALGIHLVFRVQSLQRKSSSLASRAGRQVERRLLGALSGNPVKGVTGLVQGQTGTVYEHAKFSV